MADLTVTTRIADAARRGLELHAEGKSGDGIVPATVADARRMASREALSEAKVRRMPGWFARHASDKRPGWDTAGEETPGYVAWLLWGGDTAAAWAEQRIAELDEEASARALVVEQRALPGALICDIDGTLFDDGARVDSVIDYVNAFDGAVIIVTARFISNEQSTEDQLRGVVDYDELVMRTTDEPADVYKRNAARDLQDRFVIVEAIDDDDAARDAYESLGIPATSPDDVGADDFVRSAPIGLGTIGVVNSTVEQRFVEVADIEVRDAVTGDGMGFRGYAAIFNSPSEPLPFIERIKPGAFARSLKSRNEIKMFVNHDMGRVIGSRRAGTLRLTEDDKGLAVDADLPDTTDGRDLSVLLQRGDVNSMSFGFSVPRGGDFFNAAGTERELRDVRLHEVSVVTGFPAYSATSAYVRSLDALSEKTGLDAVRMNDAITKLESGEELTADDAALLDEAIAKLRVEPVSEAAPAANLIVVKQKKLDLLMQAS